MEKTNQDVVLAIQEAIDALRKADNGMIFALQKCSPEQEPGISRALDLTAEVMRELVLVLKR